MNLPPMLLGCAVLFWGWQCGWMWVALPLALVFESARWVKVRWDFSMRDYHRVWNACLLLLLCAVIFSVGYSQTLLETIAHTEEAREGSRADIPATTRFAILFFQWWPLIFAPFMVAFLFAGFRTLPLTIFSWVARKKLAMDSPSEARASQQVAPDAVYLAIVVCSSSMSGHKGWLFFVVLAVITGWALQAKRPQRWRAVTFAVALGGAVLLGVGGIFGIRQVQALLTRLDDMVMQRIGQGRTNPFENRTQLGTLGRLKLSGGIAIRLFTTNDLPPELIREASYDTFSNPVWMLGSMGDKDRSHLNWIPISAEMNATWWVFPRVPTESKRNSVRMAQFMKSRRGLLSVPLGIASLSNLNAHEVTWTRYGSVRVNDADALLDFEVTYTEGSTIDREPTQRDLHVPADERTCIQAMALQLNLRQRQQVDQRDMLRALRGHFISAFRYSLILEPPPAGNHRMTPLGYFLQISHAGHCEYFATAACLLLRSVGVPARYAVGYSVQESAGVNQYVVRDRHAHAWCLYWSTIDNQWHDFDPTPPEWIRLEQERAAIWEPLTDMSSRLWFEFAQWRSGRSEVARVVSYVLMGILLLLLLRLFLKARRQRVGSGPLETEWMRRRVGLDSQYFEIERVLAKEGLARNPTETSLRWRKRLLNKLKPPELAVLQKLQQVHYRLRFDPMGVPEDERTKLGTEVKQWLKARKEQSR